MNEADQKKYVAHKQAVLLPGSPLYRIAVPRPMPNFTILIHGVNDLGEAYEAQEQGLCQGLNDRLDRRSSLEKAGGDLRATTYNAAYAELLKTTTDPQQRKKLEENPDAILYRRAKDENAKSPIIPFYWGFREDGAIDPRTKQPKYINTTATHGEWTDRFGNRIDKDGAKGGGPFTNATSNLPDMFGPGYQQKLVSGDPTHPLLSGPGRRYMVLAAKRLAMLIKIIRNNPDTAQAAINIVAHSQGCMVSLLAHAFLAQEGYTKVADCLIMNHPPYSLEEAALDSLLQKGGDAQTTQARLATLLDITNFMTSHKQSTPPMDSLTNPEVGVVGENWKPGKGSQKYCTLNGKKYAFEERDNRGKVYLYFCLKDATVSLETVQGIGWKGVPDGIMAHPPGPPEKRDKRKNPDHYLKAFDLLKTKHFYQRVFTARQRHGQGEAVGLPPHRYDLKKWNETTELPSLWHGNGQTAALTSDVGTFEEREINGETLNPPCIPVLTYNESASDPGKLQVSAIDARIALTHGGIGSLAFEQPDSRPVSRDGHQLPLDYREHQQLLKDMQASYDASHPDAMDSATVSHVSAYRNAKGQNLLRYVRSESPREARTRWEKHEKVDNSYHSSIVANPTHSAQITAYDLALGKPISPLMKGFQKYLCLVADWRTDWRLLDRELQKQELEYHAAEATPKGAVIPAAQELIAQTVQYFLTGKLPEHVLHCALPPLVHSWTFADRNKATEDPDFVKGLK
jgi:hypothetical protein